MEPVATATILIVDDEDLTRRTAVTLLRKSGYTVDEADGGAIALERLRQGGVDLVLLDWTMPGMSGRETLDQIRASWPELPVAVVSGAPVNVDGDAALRFLAKPFRLAGLRACVAEALGAAAT